MGLDFSQIIVHTMCENQVLEFIQNLLKWHLAQNLDNFLRSVTGEHFI